MTVPRAARLVDAGQADQVGVIIFALFERGQRGAVDLDQRAAQRLGGGPVGNALETGDGGLAAVADSKEAALEPAHIDILMPGEARRAVANSLSRTSPFTPCAPATAARATRLPVTRPA